MAEGTSHAPEQLPDRPGRQYQMKEQPESHKKAHYGTGKLQGKVVLITGGDSGIGRAIAISAGVEGACVVINYLEEGKDAAKTKRMVEGKGARCIAVSGDIGDEAFCVTLIDRVMQECGRLDILINNAAEQHPQEDISKISSEQLERTFRTNIFSMFYLTKAALKHIPKGGSIINTTSVTAYKGNPLLLDYSSTKGAIVAFTRSLSLALVEKGIRVNAVAPGPIWTPLIPSTFPPEHVEKFGEQTPMKRSGEPEEVAPAFIFLASDDASYITGQ
ncbi:MAG TPA: SDR family oxidoreductase, partial [Candidatus Saccharimonadales bacterium]|nr:SDR family oxidoreductase [Candidatus Saccharimonadales bacterium]